MRTRVFAVTCTDGLHARPAAAIIKQTQELGCCLFVKNTQAAWVEAGVMNLLLGAAAGKGSIELGVEGINEEAALDVIERVLGA